MPTDLDFSRDIWTVSRLTREVRAVLEGSFPLLWVEGEMSNLSQPASGHIYFSLKDEASQVRCAMFRNKRLLLGFRPINGQQVLARARVSLYEGRGDFQLVVEHLEPAGAGALRLEFERLKRKLAAEGLFDPALKRPLPAFPRQVGLITSPSGAAVRDLISVFGRRFPALPLVIYPTQVQGDGAVADLVEMLTLANRRAECDVLILARGGGSLEDLRAFNDEGLARAIRASAIPVVTGVGHEIDLTLADLVADQRGATPSAAAELVSPSALHLRQRLIAHEQRLYQSQARHLENLRRRWQAAERHLRLLHPRAELERRQQRTDELERRLGEALRRRLETLRRRQEQAGSRLLLRNPAARVATLRLRLSALDERLRRAPPRLIALQHEHLSGLAQALHALSPLATLARGYAILHRTTSGEVIRDATQVAVGERVTARLGQGTLTARIESTGSESA
ncbi:MAG: exodeoxyribonuclease VII large subunit [Gammaproteobacteria bacterium]|jgi:exodeoxyribonuclease VII large subunit|nr:MAG: exodeoxyribonuclease VII large subunit [Gammaproteobacteria bacterium]